MRPPAFRGKIKMTSDKDFSANVERFSGFAETYDSYRPALPAAIVDLLTQIAGVETASLVVDLGCGTGLSTRIWAVRARRVIGVEPSTDMRQQARRQTAATNVEYREGFSHETHLADRCADIVTASQSLHWMEPKPTFREIGRILRDGGVFAAIDCNWPPTTACWEVDQAYSQLMRRIKEIEQKKRLRSSLRQWDKSEHLARIKACGQFRYTKEAALHSVETGNAARYVGLVRSMGSAENLLKNGVSEQEMGLSAFADLANSRLGDKPQKWYFTYRLRIGIR